MKINKIQSIKHFNGVQKMQKNSFSTNSENSAKNTLALEALAFLGKSGVPKPKFELGLSHDELLMRANPDYLTTKKYLDVESKEYQNLEEGDKKALRHLVRAADVLNSVYKQLDNPYNLAFAEFLDNEIKKGNEDAKLTKFLFNAQNGVCSIDNNANHIELASGVHELQGKGFYPEDLKPDEFHQILINMLEDGEIEEVSKILNQRSVVARDGNKLKAIDYVDKFKDEFNFMADELELAAQNSTNKDFNEYLILQAKALREADPMLDGLADKKWATLQDTPLEFTISRENYDDEMTGTVFENEKLKGLLEKHNIVVTPKDSLGGRVGIVNKKGTEDILKIKKYLPKMAQMMPYKEKYEQSFSTTQDPKQTMVDVDLVSLTGMASAYRAGFFVAQNLPNGDKYSIKHLDGGRRNVYHRQIRTSSSPDALKKEQEKLNVLLNPELHKYYNQEAHHWFVVGHENAHSLGPNEGREALGKYKSIIEENKADMASIAMLDLLCNEGMYTEEQKKQILVTFAVDNILKAKPTLSQAHRVRSVMQCNYFMKEGAIKISKDGILDVDLDKMIPTAQKMLKEIIDVQLSKDFSKGEKFVLDNFVWSDELDAAASNLAKTFKQLNGCAESPLAEHLLQAEN